MNRPTLDASVRLTPSPNVHFRPLGNDLVVLDFANGQYFALDEIGAEVWRQLAAGASLEEAALTISARYDVPSGTALTDIEAFASELLQRSLVVRR